MTSTKELQEKLDFPPPRDWALDPVHTVAGFVGRYLMITKVFGNFIGVTGTIHIAEVPQESWVEVSLDTDSIT
ncbi:MAG: YceI family protein, partial [Actinobacteria bacterium]|nr:YceI family protein [Actinomycetota bacterium]